MSTILVTGAAGFAGSHLLDLLHNAPGPHRGPHQIVGWTRRDADLLDRETVRDAIAALRPDEVYHCAGSPHVGESWGRTAETLAVNVLGTHHLLDALRRTGRRVRVLIPGSAHVYAATAPLLTEESPVAPASPYAISKLAQELLGLRAVAEDGLDVIVTRSFNHTGARQSPTFMAPSMARQVAAIERGEAPPVIKVGNLDARRDLTDVRDTVRAYTLLMRGGTPGTVYNVATGVAHATRDVLDTLVGMARIPVHVEVDPARLRPNDIPVLAGDPSRLQTATGWTPAVAFEQMLADLLDYWRQQPAQPS